MTFSCFRSCEKLWNILWIFRLLQKLCEAMEYSVNIQVSWHSPASEVVWSYEMFCEYSGFMTFSCFRSCVKLWNILWIVRLHDILLLQKLCEAMEYSGFMTFSCFRSFVKLRNILWISRLHDILLLQKLCEAMKYF